MAIEFNTTQYVAAHGRAPRGRGYWAFRFRRSSGRIVGGTYWGVATSRPVTPVAGVDDLEFAPGERLFSEAKLWARARAVELRATTVEVLP